MRLGQGTFGVSTEVLFQVEIPGSTLLQLQLVMGLLVIAYSFRLAVIIWEESVIRVVDTSQGEYWQVSTSPQASFLP